MKKLEIKQGYSSSRLRRIAKMLYVFDWAADLVVISNVVCIVILLNNSVPPQVEYCFEVFLDVSLLFLFLELGIRMYYRKGFWRSSGDLFDLAVTTICAVSLVPSLISLRTLRMVRLVRILRIFSINKHIRLFSEAMLRSLPRIAWSSIFFGMMLLIYAIIGMDSFGETAPEYFDTFGSSLFTLFQVMSLESWASAVARPIMSTHPFAWLYFVSYILIVSYILLNLVAGVITSTTLEIYEKKSFGNASHKEILEAIARLEDQVEELSQQQSKRENEKR